MGMNWDFKHRPDRQYHYETYMPRGPRGEVNFIDVYTWLWFTFGHPGPELGNGTWDSHDRWIKLKTEAELSMFLLRWT